MPDFDHAHECYASEIDNHYIFWHSSNQHPVYHPREIIGVSNTIEDAKERLYTKSLAEAQRMADVFNGEIKLIDKT